MDADENDSIELPGQQSHPLLSGAEEATEEDRLRGLLDQMRNDTVRSRADLEKLLQTRLDDTGIELTADQQRDIVDELMAQREE
jgi:hypothetical protein